MRSILGGARQRGSTLLAALSVVQVLACLLPIPTESLWPVRMVAREIAPWFLVVNLLGIVLTIHGSRARRALFGIGFIVAAWPIAQIRSVDADITAQWRHAGFREAIRVAGPIDAIVESFRGLAVSEVQPEALSPAIHLYRSPDHPRGERLPTIVDIHGGSWQVGGVREDAVFSQRMAAKGYAVFALDYRKAPKFTFPAQWDDVRYAIAWVRDNAARLGGDPDRIALIGRSAGGQLAMLAACERTATPVRSVVSFYGPADLAALYEDPPSPDPLHVRAKLEAYLGGTPEALPDVYRSASPASCVRAALPPTLLIQGGSDNVVQARLTRAVHSRLLAADSRSLLLEIPWADHSFDFVYFGPSNAVAQSALESFLRETLR
jgi:acetyl esterase/lipase